MSALRIGFIGAGNMAQALAKGLVASGVTSAGNITASSPPADQRLLDTMAEMGCRVTYDNCEAAANNDVTVLAVKPNVVSRVLQDIKEHVTSNGPLVASIAMGVPLSVLEGCLAPGARVVRCMPNTPALLMQGASVYCRGHHATEEDSKLSAKLLQSVGLCDEVPESQLDAVTGLSGAGPAYTCLIIEALADGGVKMGLPRQLAMKLAAQTLAGAAGMVLASNSHPGALKDAVCSPGGCSIAGVSAMEEAGVRGGLIAAVEAATLKASSASKI